MRFLRSLFSILSSFLRSSVGNLPKDPGPQVIEVSDLTRDPQRGINRAIEYPPDMTVAGNLNTLATRLNKLVRRLPASFLPLVITSGYRPGHYNTNAGGAYNSPHKLGKAVDLSNVGNALGSYLKENQSILEECELWAEDPDATLKTQHLHLQTSPPPSGRRFFKP